MTDHIINNFSIHNKSGSGNISNIGKDNCCGNTEFKNNDKYFDLIKRF